MRLIRIIAASVLACSTVPLSAQTFGPPITGVCLLSRTAAIAASHSGQSMQAQLKQMQASLNGELAQRRSAIDQQGRALETKQNATAPIEYQRQLGVLNQQAQALEQQQNIRFIAAQTHAQQQVDRALGEGVARVITRRACSVVFERDQSYGWNNAMDITRAVTGEMDAVLQAVAIR
jgi:Skp family chaperone for outer membrane proteins